MRKAFALILLKKAQLERGEGQQGEEKQRGYHSQISVFCANSRKIWSLYPLKE